MGFLSSLFILRPYALSRNDAEVYDVSFVFNFILFSSSPGLSSSH